MSGATSATGLISGIDTDSLIQQLLSVEARPRNRVEQRVQVLSSQKTAFQDVNAKLLSLKGSASSFLDDNTFEAKRAASSNENVLTATASKEASVGNSQFLVDRLVSNQQMISRGLVSRDAALGIDTELTFDSAASRIDRDVELAELNAFEGVERGRIRITDRSGSTAEVDLSRAVTLDDVIQTINNTSGLGVTARMRDDQLEIVDNTGQTASNLSISNVGTSQTATSLGIAGSVAADTLTGGQINRIDGATQLDLLNDGLGVGVAGGGQNDLRIDLDGSTFDVSLDGATNLQDVIDTINDDADNPGVTAAIGDDGVSLKLTGGGTISVSALNGSEAAGDLGILGSAANTLNGDRVLATLGSKLIRSLADAGSLNLGQVSVDTGAGAQSIDLSNATTVAQVLDTINDAGAGVTASANDAGNGIRITADNGNPLTISDSTGNFADTLGLAGTHSNGAADSGDLDVRYLSETTKLGTLNGGSGISAGQFRITNAAGEAAVIDLTQDEQTLGEVIAEINSRGIDVTASINQAGDGLLLTDNSGGSTNLKVEELGGSTAADLGILGEDTENNGFIDGSFETRIEVAAEDTLNDVRDKINAAGLGVEAEIINDGTASRPFRLNLASTETGRAGRMAIDDGDLGLDLNTLSEGRDAVVFFGASDPANGVLLTSSTNTLENTLAGTTIELTGASDDPVTLSIARDNEKIVQSVGDFVENFNTIMDELNQLDDFDTETEERGLLLGDPTIANIKRQLTNFALQGFEDVQGRFNRLSQVGVTIGEEAKLTFDEDALRQAIATDADAVAELFSRRTRDRTEDEQITEGVTIPGGQVITTSRGAGATLDELITGLTNSIDGTITNKTDNLDRQIELANDRIEQLNTLLDDKRQRLERQFAGMEQSLARLQDQQSALQSLSQLAAGGGQ